MTLLEAIKARHSVRRYKDMPLAKESVATLNAKINEINEKGNLHIQLVQNEPKAFLGVLSYGKFYGVKNYIIMAGKKDKTLDGRVGYYGEQLVLLAQQLGLNTCWVGLSYHKVGGTYSLDEGEQIACYIALGYGETQGVSHKSKSPEQISNVTEESPQWFKDGVEAALLAPTAINQQKFYFEYMGLHKRQHLVTAKRGFSLAGYTKMDLGIAKLHFEIAAGKDNFEWA